MSSYEVGDHLVDHPPLFACRKHKSFLRLNRAFVDELLAWAPDIQPQNLTDIAASSLDGDDQAFRLSEYLVPPKITIFNPRKIQGHGALPYTIVLVDKKFFGIPSSYLRRRIFDGCADCAAENDPASDASFPDYKAPPKKAPAPAPSRPATGSGPIPVPGARAPSKTQQMAKPAAPASGATKAAPSGPPPSQAPGAPQKPTRQIPARPAAPTYDAPPVKKDPDSHG